MAVKLFFLAFVTISAKAYKLDRVVILGRHNLRAPLHSNSLERVTPEVWPRWSDPPAYLTDKGRLLESYMGEYFSQWFKKEGLFLECPKRNATFIYANSPQRTRETAQEFADAAFKNCNLSVIYHNDVTMDPIFNPIIRNESDEFILKVTGEMQNKLDGLKLENAYEKLNQILKINKSQICIDIKLCDLTKNKNDVFVKVHEEPNIYGPLRIGSSVVDNFLMTFYNGTELQNIGWGGIREEDWKDLTEITRESQNVRFNTATIVFHVADLLLRKFEGIISNDNLKFALLVGHDSNITPVLAALGVKPFELPDQFERTPIGGKLVFQKWYDEARDDFLLKVDYVYQTTDQLRRGTALSMDSPPNNVTLELTDCKADKNGFCPWAEFIRIVSKFK